MPIDHPRYTHVALDRFAPLARQYCTLLAEASKLSASELLLRVQLLLPTLYFAALELPSTGVLFNKADTASDADEDGQGPIDPTTDPKDIARWAAEYRSLSTKLGKANYYREVFDPYEPTTELEVMGSLADDLKDIHRDLEEGLLLWDQGETGEALWEWRFGFEIHWGEHLTGALRAIHVRCSTYDQPWPSSVAGTDAA